MTISRSAALREIEAPRVELGREAEIRLLRRCRANEIHLARSYKSSRPEWATHHVKFARDWHRKLMALKWPIELDKYLGTPEERAEVDALIQSLETDEQRDIAQWQTETITTREGDRPL